MKEIELKTKRLILRPMTRKYLKTTYQYSSDIENTRYMLYLPYETLEEAREQLNYYEEEWKRDNPIYYEFAILLGNEHIGEAGVDYNEDRTVMEFGWILDKNYWGKGYAVEAVQAVLQFAIEELGAKHFCAHCDSENIASRRVMEKLGMVQVDAKSGRKNRSSDEVREELTFELHLPEI